MKHHQSIKDKDKKYLWHPFTQMKDWMENDIIVVEKSKGNYLYDTEGKKYLDGISSLWCNVHGHRVKAIDRAIEKQLSKITHSTLLGLSNIPAIELAESLIKIAPKGLSRVFYSDNGSTAMEIALKMAFQYWRQLSSRKTDDTRKKTKFLTFVNGYHGDTIGSVSLGGIELFHSIYKPLLFSTIRMPGPYCYRCPFHKSRDRCQNGSVMEGCISHIEKVIQKHHQKLSGVVIEPLIQGASGMLTQPPGFVKTIRHLCDKYDILMIADEVATGFGRTGLMFACEHEAVTPDIMAIAKGITAGYLPLAATLTTEKVFNAFLGKYEEKKTFFHGHTYSGNPLACVSALENLKIFRKEKTIQTIQPKIEFLKEKLKRFYDLKNVGDIRQVGLMVGIELVKDRETKEPFPYSARMGHRVILKAREYGVILRPLGDVVVLMPPLSITLGELKFLMNAPYNAIREVTSGF
ncbi:MAG: adenosylmethionine--8-amino-7-oxononanoate transaminase [Planctomycetota bacterium]|nr:adenosylmethionine--8-amino-7-oxononanoate transaminase [Planctomycetota bacterium]MDI6787276.1 adenosylmethionine--8-amino-7-oxononanoate transaminase [Planctomycetota bacterium]